jgi:hypothetical protein
VISEDLFDPAVVDDSIVRWKYGLTIGGLWVGVQTMRKCCEAELRVHVFLRGLRYPEFYRDPIGPWWLVAKFFGCGDDIGESRKGIAVRRFAAGVFH